MHDRAPREHREVDESGTPRPAAAPRPVPRFSLLDPERGRSSHDQIAAILGTELLQGRYAPGSTMPAEAELAARFHVSRTVLREVMKTLAAKGFVVPKTRVGIRVRDAVFWNYFDADVLAWRLRLGLDDAFLETLTEIRRALEPTAARNVVTGTARSPRGCRTVGCGSTQCAVGARPPEPRVPGRCAASRYGRSATPGPRSRCGPRSATVRQPI